MCQIMVALTARPTAAELSQSATSNPDGCGIAWQSDHRPDLVQWKKGITVETLQTLAEKVPLPFMVHTRLATHGDPCEALCHPFPLTPVAGTAAQGHARAVLMHNGIWSDYSRYKPRLNGPVSDTRVLAHVLAKKQQQHPDRINAGARKFAQNAGRLAIWRDGEIKRYGQWTDGATFSAGTAGVWYSNTGWCYSYTPSSWRGYDYSAYTRPAPRWNADILESADSAPAGRVLSRCWGCDEWRDDIGQDTIDGGRVCPECMNDFLMQGGSFIND